MPKIVINGKAYDSPDDMPPDVRQIWESLGGLLADRDGDGVPDIAEHAGQVVHAATTFVVDGKAYQSLDELPSEARQRYEQAMARFDANGDGVPDMLQGGAFSGNAAPAPPAVVPPASPGGHQQHAPQLVKVVGSGPGAGVWIAVAIGIVLLLAIGAILLFGM